MNRINLVNQLNKVADKVVTVAIQKCTPMRLTKNSILLGNIFVEKNNKGMYNVLSFNKAILYEDISVFDVAIIVAQRYHSNEMNVIKQVLILEEKYSKYHNDMVHYLHCMKISKKRQDTDRLAILEDKFQLAEQRAKDIRDNISTFKRNR